MSEGRQELLRAMQGATPKQCENAASVVISKMVEELMRAGYAAREAKCIVAGLCAMHDWLQDPPEKVADWAEAAKACVLKISEDRDQLVGLLG